MLLFMLQKSMCIYFCLYMIFAFHGTTNIPILRIHTIVNLTSEPLHSIDKSLPIVNDAASHFSPKKFN